MDDFPHPTEIRDDEEMNKWNSRISQKTFIGIVQGSGNRKKGAVRGGWAFLVCNNLPDRILAIGYNVTTGNLITGAEIEFTVRYRPIGDGTYGLQMFEGTSDKSQTPTIFPRGVFLTEVPEKGSDEKRELLEECEKSLNQHGFLVLSCGEQCDNTAFFNFVKNVSKKNDAELLIPKKIEELVKSDYVFNSIKRNKAHVKVIIKPEQKKNNRQIRLSLTDATHRSISSIQKDQWVIVADEAGDPKNAFGSEAIRTANMIFIAIPPGVELPILHPEYHSHDKQWIDHRVNALRSLCENDGVLIFNFEAGTEGYARSREGITEGVGNDPNKNMWHSIYLVLEYISNLIEDPVDVNIYFERHTQTDPGLPILEESVSHVRDLLNEREGWSNMRLTEGGPTILAKGDHGSLAYSDVAGLCFYSSSVINIHYKKIEIIERQLRDQSISSYFDTDAINRVTEVIRSSRRGRSAFLEAVLELNEFEINEYAKKFLRHHSEYCINNLTESEWNNFNAKSQNMLSESSEHWRAYEFLLSLFDGGIERLTAELSGGALLGALLGLLASANHKADIETAEAAKVEITKLIDSSDQPISEDGRTRAINNLCVHYQNQFAFEKIDGLCEHRNVIRAMGLNSIEGVRLRGTIMQNKSFLGRLKEALDDWDSLNDAARWNGEDLLRQRIYRFHILIDDGEYQSAQDELKQAGSEFMAYLGEPCSDHIEALRCLLTDDRGLFLYAALFKAVSRASQVGLHDDKLLELLCSEDIERRLRRLIHYSKHPVQSIWFWAIKLLQGADDPQLAAELKNRLLENCDDTLRDAFGLMYACYRLDLSSDDSGEFDEAQIYFREIFERSTSSTREWVESRISSANDVESLDSFLNFDTKCDRLRPLTFNYL